jgi:hypothetical protein
MSKIKRDDNFQTATLKANTAFAVLRRTGDRLRRKNCVYFDHAANGDIKAYWFDANIHVVPIGLPKKRSRTAAHRRSARLPLKKAT